MKWFAACPKGLELLLVDELLALGATSAREALAGVHCEGDLEFGYRACLYSRLASRVLMPLAEFDAGDADKLHEGVHAIDWPEHLAQDRTIAVAAHGSTRGISNSMFAAQRVKDAIVDRMRAEGLPRPDVDADAPDLRIDLVLRHERGILSLDFAGAPLHQRGYRRGTGAAPLKENLAAAVLIRAGWPAIAAAGGALVDPMCGSGTLLIEGAWIAADVAPGLARERFGLEGWAQFDAPLWERLRAAARQRADAGLAILGHRLFGSDRDAAVIAVAKANAQAAGVAGFLTLATRDVARLVAPAGFDTGLVVANPPYGERLDADVLGETHAALGKSLRDGFAGWPVALLVADADMGRATGMVLRRRYKLFNGSLPVELLLLDADARRERESVGEREQSDGEIAVGNRITKNEKKLRSWRRRESIDCWRAYDADLPEYSAAIDVYRTQDEETWLVVQEYAAPPSIPVATAQRRLREVVHAASVALAVPRSQVVVKTRSPGQRAHRARPLEHAGRALTVVESGLGFEVNLSDYLDTGLFLDHRPMRARVRDAAQGKRVLNLFCYTGSATVYAVAGGAHSSMSVDLSGTYLEWASRNFDLNGIAGSRHRLAQADVMFWLAAENEKFDLIFVDPPSFSNSARAQDFDVQRDHADLLRRCARVLAPGGMVLFSCNLRRFRLDHEVADLFDVRDISRATIPPDFARDQRIHHAYEMRPH